MKKNWIVSFISIIALYFVSTIAVIAFFLKILGVDYENTLFSEIEWIYLFSGLTNLLMIIGVIIFYKKLINEDLLEAAFKQRSYILMSAGVVLCLVVNFIRDIVFGHNLGNLSDLLSVAMTPLLISILALLISVIFEELIFRKYLVELGEGLGLNVIVSIFISAILFALAHSIHIENSWFVIIMALFLSYTRYLFDSIAFAVGVHFAFNVLITSYNVPIDEPLLGFDNADYSDISLDWAFQSIRFFISCFTLLLISLPIFERMKSLLTFK